MMDKHGADVLRWYLVGNSPIGKSKNFNEDEMVDVKNKFFDTLINTYKFFVLYSNMIGFDYTASKIVDVSERQEIDRWIISKLNSVKKKYFENLEGYEITKAIRVVHDFTIDELSNWFVRRNRKRFRYPENDADKNSAYQTLFECLLEIVKMIAPVSPFIAEKLYCNLLPNEGSVHLSEFTNFDEANIVNELEEQMAMAQEIVYLVRAVRVKNNLKVRQPLRQLLVPVLSEEEKNRLLKVKDIILEEINVKELKILEGDSDIIVKKAKPNFKSIGPKFGKDVKQVQKIILGFDKADISVLQKSGKVEKEGFTFTNDDLELYTENIEGWIVESNNAVTIALDTKLDKELADEGFVREFINRVQNYRKNNDFEVNDKISIFVKTNDDINSILSNNIEFIKKEVGCKKMENNILEGKEYINTDINDVYCEFYIEKI